MLIEVINGYNFGGEGCNALGCKKKRVFEAKKRKVREVRRVEVEEYKDGTIHAVLYEVDRLGNKEIKVPVMAYWKFPSGGESWSVYDPIAGWHHIEPPEKLKQWVEETIKTMQFLRQAVEEELKKRKNKR